MKKSILFIIIFLSLMIVQAQDHYDTFRNGMTAIEKQEQEIRSVIWGKNNYTQLHKDSVYKEYQVLVKDKVQFAQRAIDSNRADKRFLKVLDIYVRNFLTLDEFEAELKQFSPEVQASPECKKNFEFVKYARLMIPGNKCIDFEVTGHNGKTIRLADVLKQNKLVLVDFWASWCGACRAGMPHLRDIYAGYKAKGVEFFSVSLDDQKTAWEKAYKDENIPWIDGSNLLGWKDPIALWYALRGIPHQILINRDGIIIGNCFYELGSLEKKIDEYLKL